MISPCDFWMLWSLWKTQSFPCVPHARSEIPFLTWKEFQWTSMTSLEVMGGFLDVGFRWKYSLRMYVAPLAILRNFVYYLAIAHSPLRLLGMSWCLLFISIDYLPSKYFTFLPPPSILKSFKCPSSYLYYFRNSWSFLDWHVGFPLAWQITLMILEFLLWAKIINL